MDDVKPVYMSGGELLNSLSALAAPDGPLSKQFSDSAIATIEALRNPWRTDMENAPSDQPVWIWEKGLGRPMIATKYPSGKWLTHAAGQPYNPTRWMHLPPEPTT